MASSKVKKRTSNNQSDSPRTIFETAPKAALLMLLSGLIILLIAALLSLRSSSPLSLAGPAALCALYIGAFVGGLFCSSQTDGADSIISSLIAALMIILLLITAKIFIPKPVASINPMLSVIFHSLTAAAAVLGALVGEKQRSTKRRRKKNKHYRS